MLDDVHAGIEVIRKSFGCELPADAVAELQELLARDLQELMPAEWSAVESGNSRIILEVPFWVYSANLQQIRKILAKHAGSKEMVFAWPHLLHLLESCRLIIAGGSAYLALDPPAVERVPHYAHAVHRLYMSASIHDGAVLIRELDCSPQSAADPVEIHGETTVGERMVIVPSLINTEFSQEELIQVALAIKPYANVVVLVSSYPDAGVWKDAGAVVALNEDIGSHIASLKAVPRGQLVVFVQRYDGVDLPDSACRLLIIDGLPKGESLLDKAEAQIVGGVVGMRGKLANKIEQGLGRAVRSGSDYCGVVLGGRDVAGFVSRSVVLESFSPQTVRQLEVGRAVSEALKDSATRVQDVVETLLQCLRRDEDWKTYYQASMRSESTAAPAIRENAAKAREVAERVRNASRKAASRDYGGASALLQSAAAIVASDRPAKGALKQSSAKFLFQLDPVSAMELQASAYGDNYQISRPPMLLPVDVRKITSQAAAIAAWLAEFREPNGALLELDELRSQLAFANESNDVERAMQRLGDVLGAVSTRPDHEGTRGPDNLWIFGDTAFVIEMKSGKFAAFSKDDAEQLHSSILWVSKNIPGMSTVHAIMGSNVDRADEVKDFAFGAGVIAEVDFLQMVARLRKLVAALSTQGPLFASSAANVQKYLGPNELLPAQLMQAARKIRSKR